ncbi:MAG: DUF3015 family protein [Bacteriovoracia bacterium]
MRGSLKMLALLAVLMTLAAPALAAKNAWTQCGIGAMVFPKTGWAAMTSNMIWDLGTTGTTSSSSSESQCAGRASTAAKFIHQNYAVIEEETVVGEGAHIKTVLNILDCKNNSHDKIIKSLRTQYANGVDSVVPSDEAYFNNLMEVIESDYPTQCKTT